MHEDPERVGINKLACQSQIIKVKWVILYLCLTLLPSLIHLFQYFMLRQWQKLFSVR